MKLLSFAADGKEWFGAARDDGVITLNDKVGQPNLRAALAAGAMDAMRGIVRDTAAPDRKLSEIRFLPVIPRDSLRRHQLSLACYRDGTRLAKAAEHVH